MCHHQEIPYKVMKQRERAIQCGKDIFDIYKAIDMVKTPEIKDLFETEFAPRLQEIRHKLEGEL